MKKLLNSVAFLFLLTSAIAQNSGPDCANNTGLEGRINGIESSGWKEISRNFYPVLYKVAPEPPYLIGTLEIIFGKDCKEGEACPEIAMLYSEDAWQVSQNTCVWQAGNR